MKILSLVNAHALAHVSRTLEVAKALRVRGHEIVFAGHGKYLSIAATDAFATIELPFVPIEQVVAAIKSQALLGLYRDEQLTEFVEAELALYELTKPDIVLADCRLTASTSAELARIPLVTILNVHMSLFKKIPFYSLQNMLPGTMNWLTGLSDKAENHLEALFYHVVMAGMNRVRRKLGLRKRYGYHLEEGDITLFPDIPEFNPVRLLPPNAHFVGPLTWHNDLPAPECMSQLDPEKKCIYLSLGSEGLENLFGNMSIFADKPIQVVVATGQLTPESGMRFPDNVFFEQYVNTDRLLPRCHMVVCHGGNGTLYQALGHGLPVVGLATHEEQYYGLKRINQLGLGIGLSERKLGIRASGALSDAIEKVITDDRYATNAKAFQRLLKRYDGPNLAADIIEGNLPLAL